MAFDRAPYNAQTIGLMCAALDTAWIAARIYVPDLSYVDRANMEKAILDSAALGVRDFQQLQQHAFDVLNVCGIEPVERRLRPRPRLKLVSSEKAPSDRGSPRAKRRTSP